MKTLGDLNSKQELQQAIRVDHAGEFGAKRIYAGQIAAFKLKNDAESVKLIQHMKDQEDVHFEYFNKKIIENKVRPTVMQPVWNVAGFALGFITAAVSKKAAMACTVAVEEVIDEHYQSQLNTLKDIDLTKNEDLKEKIEQFRQEELEHRDIGIENDAEDLKFYQPLTFLIKRASKLAIAISSKI